VSLQLRCKLSRTEQLVAIAAALLISAGVTAKPSVPQTAAKLPSAQWVLDRNVEATGGKDALLRHKSMTIHGRYQAPAQKLDVETVFYTKDGKLLLKAALPEGKEYATGFDGQTSWVLDPAGKVTIQQGDEVKSVARDADMYYHLHVMKYFKSFEVVDIQEFNGRACYHLKGLTNWDKPNEHFYDKENGLLLGYAFQGSIGPATETFEEYKDFGGVKMPAKTTSRDGDQMSLSLITAVTYDDVDDAVLALPGAVQKAKNQLK